MAIKKLALPCIFISDPTIDTGDIISIARRKADYSKSFISNVFGLYKDGAMMIRSFIDDTVNGRAVLTTKQDIKLGLYFSYPDDTKISALSINLA